jgi:hypothetical protein
MTRNRAIGAVAFVVLLGFLLLAAPPRAQEASKEAKGQTTVASRSVLPALPGDATLIARVRDVSDLVEKVKKSPLYRLKEKPEFADLVKKIEAAFEGARGKVRAELDIDLMELLTSIEGEIVLYAGNAWTLFQSFQTIERGPDANAAFESLPLVLAVDAQGASGKLKGLLAKVWEYGRKEGAKIEHQDFHNGVITVLTNPDAADGGPEHLYLAEHGTKFLFGASRKLLEATVANLDSGKGGGLDANAVFQKTQGATEGEASDLSLYVDLKQITDAVDKGVASAGGFQSMIWSSVKNIVFGKSLNSVGLAGFFDERGIRQTLFVHNAGASDGLLGWFKGAPFSSTPAAVIPPEVATFSTLAFNGPNFAVAVRQLIKLGLSFQGGGDSADPDAQVEAMLGIKLEDIFRGLGSRIHAFGFGEGPNLENPLGDQTFVLELQDEAPFKQLLGHPLLASGALQSRKYMERDIFSPAGVAEGAGPAFCISDRMLIVSLDGKSVEKTLRRAGKEGPGLGDQEGYKKIAAIVPPKVAFLGYSDEGYIAKTFGSVSEMIRESAAAEVPEDVFLLLAAVGKFLGATIAYGAWQDAGLFYDSRMLYR